MITLRDYQKECLEAIQKAKSRSKLVVLPTGSGKTIIFLNYILKNKSKALILAHTQDLIRQTHERLLQINPKSNAVIMNYSNNIFDADIVIGTIQGCSRGNSLQRLKEKNFDTIIIDEAHHAMSNSYLKLINTINPDESKELIGFTATPVRGDGQKLSQVFKEEVFRKDLFDLMNMGILTDIIGYRVKTGLSLDGVRTKYGDYALNELAAAVNTKERNFLTLKSYKEICPYKKTLIFCTDIKHAEEMAQVFRDEKIDCKAIHGKLPKDQRIQILKDFKEGKINVLTNCQLLTEGFDEPSIEALVMARPTKSLPLYIQMIGRGIRTHQDKKNCLLIELTDNKHDICYLPKLITNECESFTNGSSIRKFKKELSQEKQRRDIFEESDQSLHIEKYNPIKKDDYFKNSKTTASKEQLELMLEYKIKWIEPLSYEIAALMISNHRHRMKWSKKHGAYKKI